MVNTVASSRGGHGRTPGATDPRQGRARADGYFRQTASGIVAVIASVGVVAVVVAVSLLVLRPGGLPWAIGLSAAMILVFFVYRARRRSSATSIGKLGEKES